MTYILLNLMEDQKSVKRNEKPLCLSGQAVDFFLQVVQEKGGVGSVHLGVVELEGNGEEGPEEVAAVFAPYHEGVVEYAAVHAHGSVYLVPGEGGSADDHAVGQVVVFASFCDLGRQAEIVGVELVQVIGERDVAGADFAPAVGDNRVDGDAVVLHQFTPHRKHPEFLDAACCTADAPAHKHVELQTLLSGQTDQPGHIQFSEECDHGHGGVHPHFECVCPRGLLRVHFCFHCAFAFTSPSSRLKQIISFNILPSSMIGWS